MVYALDFIKCLYILQSHHWSVFTVKSFAEMYSTCGVHHDVTGHATGRHQDIQQQHNNVCDV